MNEFEQIYRTGGWDGEGSGPGSTEEFTREFRLRFQALLENLNIKSVFDLGCGDWQWQQYLNWNGVRYKGWDVSESAVHKGTCTLPLIPTDAASVLECHDAFLEPLWPEADLLLVKDVVHHISPYRVRMLIERAKLYSYVVWVMDVNEALTPINWHSGSLFGYSFYTFDTSPPYRYGPKMAFLQTNR